MEIVIGIFVGVCFSFVVSDMIYSHSIKVLKDKNKEMDHKTYRQSIKIRILSQEVSDLKRKIEKQIKNS